MALLDELKKIREKLSMDAAKAIYSTPVGKSIATKLSEVGNRPVNLSPTTKAIMAETENIAGRFLKGASLGYADPFKSTPLSQALGVQKMTPTDTAFGKVAGFVAEQAPSFIVGGAAAKGLKGVESINALQKTLGTEASKLIAQGGITKLGGQALANMSQGIPFGIAYSALNQIQNINKKDYNIAKDFGSSIAFDLATGSLPILGIVVNKTPNKKDLLKQISNNPEINKLSKEMKNSLSEELVSMKKELGNNMPDTSEAIQTALKRIYDRTEQKIKPMVEKAVKTPIKTDVIKIPGTDYIFNVGKTATENKQIFENVINDTKKEITNTLGEKLSFKEIQDKAVTANSDLIKTIGRQKTAEIGASALKLRQEIDNLANEGYITPDFKEKFLTLKSYQTNIARLLGQMNITATGEAPKNKLLLRMLSNIDKVGADMDEVLKKAEGVDFNNQKEATAFYRQYVKPNLEDWVNKVRYNSMLSSPLTQLVNIAGNIWSLPVETARREIRPLIDATSSIFGGERKYYSGEGVKYAKGYFAELGNAVSELKKSLQGIDYSTEDIRQIPLTTGGLGNVTESALDAPGRMMYGADRFFTALAKNAEVESELYRLSKKAGREIQLTPTIEKEALKRAQKTLYTSELKQEGEGYISDAFGSMGRWVNNLRNSNNPYLRLAANFTIPFVNTGTNITKTMVEYNPLLGTANLVGTKDKVDALSKIALGGIITAMAAPLMSQDRITFSKPKTDKRMQEKNIPPYSIKIKDKWISYRNMHPVISMNLAMIGSLKELQDKGEMDPGTAESAGKIMSDMLSFTADQSYYRGLSDFMDLISGKTNVNLKSVVSGYVSQLIPFRSGMSWANNMLDAYVRDPETLLDYIKMKIPGLSTTVPAKEIGGEPVKKQDRFAAGLSPYAIKTERLPDLSRQIAAGKDVEVTVGTLNEYLKNIPRGEAAKYFESLKKENPQKASRLKKMVELEKMGINEQEGKIQNLGVKNGKRAEEIYKRYVKAGRDKSLLAKYWDAGFINEEVYKQIEELRKKDEK